MGMIFCWFSILNWIRDHYSPGLPICSPVFSSKAFMSDPRSKITWSISYSSICIVSLISCPVLSLWLPIFHTMQGSPGVFLVHLFISSYNPFTTLLSVTHHFVTVLVLPIPWSWRTSIVNPTCFPWMKKLPLCLSSWAKQFPFAPFSQNLLFFPIYKTDANGFCPPCTNMHGLILSLELNGLTELCSSWTGPLMECFLNKEPKLPAVEAS